MNTPLKVNPKQGEPAASDPVPIQTVQAGNSAVFLSPTPKKTLPAGMYLCRSVVLTVSLLHVYL